MKSMLKFLAMSVTAVCLANAQGQSLGKRYEGRDESSGRIYKGVLRAASGTLEVVPAGVISHRTLQGQMPAWRATTLGLQLVGDVSLYQGLRTLVRLIDRPSNSVTQSQTSWASKGTKWTFIGRPAAFKSDAIFKAVGAKGGVLEVAPTSSQKVPPPPPQAPARDAGSHLNPLQRDLMMYIIYRKDQLKDSASDDRTKNRIILAQCVALQHIMDEKQQQITIQEVYRLNEFQPSPSPWDQVRRAKSMVKELLVVSPEQIKKLEQMAQEYARTQGESNTRSMTPQQHFAEYGRRMKARVAAVYAILTPAQQKEWDKLVAAAEAEMGKAARR